ncbi:MAG: hypothetical protein ACREVR_18945 [Burkholderiales bacterium]
MSIRKLVQSAVSNTPAVLASKRLLAAALFPALALGGCYVVPVGPNNEPWLVLGGPFQPSSTFPSGSPSPAAPQGPALPKALNVRLYPANDIANQTGMLTGTVTNMMSGRGRFQFQYQGELLAGEATRVSGEERKGIASAYGPSGTYASCEYQMNSPVQGAGTCQFSNGARYQVHIGS